VHQVGFIARIYRDARSTKHNIFHKVQNVLSASCFRGYRVIQLVDIQGRYMLRLKYPVMILHNAPEDGRYVRVPK
jgi:hypothetical protein